jgi:hypothetical protein
MHIETSVAGLLRPAMSPPIPTTSLGRPTRTGARRLAALAVLAALATLALPAGPVLAADGTPPAVTTPKASPQAGGTVTTATVPFRVTFGASDGGSGLRRTRLQVSVDGGSWSSVSLATSTSRSATVRLAPPHEARFRANATDAAGNTSAWVYGATFRVRRVNEAATGVSTTGTWTTVHSTAYLGGAALRSRAAGATLTYSFTGSKVAWIGRRSPSGGSARVYLDGAYRATVNTRSSATRDRRVIYVASYSGSARHTLTIRVSGTAGHPDVVVDGFVLVDPPSPDAVLVGAGDIARCGASGDEATARLISGIAGRAFTAGDNAYANGSASNYANCYDPSWGRFRSRTSPAPGNHEYNTSGAVAYWDYFGARAGTRGKGWYAYDLGAWRIYSLNGNCTIVGCGATSPQVSWLKADLAANPRACVAAIWHQPLFSSGSEHGNDPRVRPLWQALQDAGAEVIVNGHDHDYERFAPQTADAVASATGIREFVVGTGGGDLRTWGTIKANSQVRDVSTYGVLKLTLRAGSYEWRFLPAGGGTFTDSGSGACH